MKLKTTVFAILSFCIVVFAVYLSGISTPPSEALSDKSNPETNLRQYTIVTTTKKNTAKNKSNTKKTTATTTTKKAGTTKSNKTTKSEKKTKETTTTTKSATKSTKTTKTNKTKSNTTTTKKQTSNTTTTAAQTTTKKEQKKIFQDSDLEMMAIVIYREAGGDAYSNKTRIMVGNVVMNRVRSSRFPNTIYGVLTQRGQYAGMSGAVRWPSMASNRWEQNAVKRAWACARRVQAGENYLPANVVYQSDYRTLGSGIYCRADGMYFNYM